jgi:hypothetical protein
MSTDRTVTQYRTGYWANMRGNQSGIHLEEKGRGACGYEPAGSMVWQFCANGIHPQYVTCRRCRRIVDRIMKETLR